MSTFATVADFKQRFASDAEVAALTDNTAAEGPDTDVIQDALDEAEGVINSYLSKRYAVPPSVTDSVVAATLRGCTLDIAVYHVVGGRSDVISEAKRLIYEQRLAWLKAVSMGDVFLPSAAPLGSTSSSAYMVAWGSGDADVASDTAVRTFSRASMAGL